MRKRHVQWISLLSIAALLLTSCSPGAVLNAVGLAVRQPDETSEELFKGIRYTRLVETDPRLMVIHLIEIDLKAAGIEPLVTPADEDGDKPVEARTTSTFLLQFGVQLAINGDAFFVPNEHTFQSDYPDPGDLINPTGFAASRGVNYSQDTDYEHTLYISKTNRASIDQQYGSLWMAVSGSKLLVNNGKAVVNDDDFGPVPRTAVGTNRQGNKLLIVVVDGRQPGYSEGATLLELSSIMLEHKMYDAINLDGGGSSTLVIEGPDGNPLILNSPVHNGLPGTERAVANHLGFYAKP